MTRALLEQQAKQDFLIDKRRRLASVGVDWQEVNAVIIAAWGSDRKRRLRLLDVILNPLWLEPPARPARRYNLVTWLCRLSHAL